MRQSEVSERGDFANVILKMVEFVLDKIQKPQIAQVGDALRQIHKLIERQIELLQHLEVLYVDVNFRYLVVRDA